MSARQKGGTDEHPLWDHKAGKLILFPSHSSSKNIDDLHWRQLAQFLLRATWLRSLSFLPVVTSQCSLPRVTISVILSTFFASSLGRLLICLDSKRDGDIASIVRQLIRRLMAVSLWWGWFLSNSVPFKTFLLCTWNAWRFWNRTFQLGNYDLQLLWNAALEW